MLLQVGSIVMVFAEKNTKKFTQSKSQRLFLRSRQRTELGRGPDCASPGMGGLRGRGGGSEVSTELCGSSAHAEWSRSGRTRAHKA